MKPKLKIIIGSTRPGRQGPIVAAWAKEAAAAHAAFDIELVDLAELGLPLLDEPQHPAMQKYEHDHTKRWAAIIDEADAFLFVTPEYDYFPPAALVNALQCLAVEWRGKPAGVVSYAGISGGLRAAQILRDLIGNLGMVPLPNVVPVPGFQSFVSDGAFTPNEPMAQGMTGLLDALAKWAAPLMGMRGKA